MDESSGQWHRADAGLCFLPRLQPFSLREAAIASLSGEAQIVGSNSISAIVFDDRASAETTLSALSHSSDIVAAAIYTEKDVLFAEYPANGAISMERRPLANSVTLQH